MKHGIKNPTYNWPYDFFSLLELAKIDAKVGFRPDLRDEYNQVTDDQTNVRPVQLNIPVGSVSNLAPQDPLTLTLLGASNTGEET